MIQDNQEKDYYPIAYNRKKKIAFGILGISAIMIIISVGIITVPIFLKNQKESITATNLKTTTTRRDRSILDESETSSNTTLTTSTSTTTTTKVVTKGSQITSPTTTTVPSSTPICLANLHNYTGTLVTLCNQGSFSSDPSAVTVSGSTVTIKKGGIFTLNGTLSNGSVAVSAPGQSVTLILNGVNITNQTGPAIVFINTSSSQVTLASTNYLTDTAVEARDYEDYNAALYSVASITLDGNGTLNINGRSQEGIATENHMTIHSGNYYITALDDGLNANNDGVSIITINGGYLKIDANGDGIDSNGNLTINGGTVISSSRPAGANGGLDADGTITINGGVVLATGDNNDKPTISSPQQFIVAKFSHIQSSNTVISIKQNGTIIAAFALPKATSELIFSNNNLQDNNTYDIYVGGTLVGSQVNGIYTQSSGGTLSLSVST